MKILYLITKSERGGAQAHVLTLMRLQRAGTPVLAVGDEGFLAEEARRAGIRVYVIASLTQPIHPGRDLRACRELLELVRSVRPDLIHAHTAKAGMIGRIAGFLTRTPTIYTVHAWSFDAMRTPASKALCVWIERALSMLNQTVIEVSQANFALATSKSVTRPKRHLLIRNGISDHSERAAFQETEGPVRIVMVARFARPKDHCILLEALAPLAGKWECSFVGSGPERAKVEARANSLGLSERVRFLGDRDDVAELLAQSHLFVLCSGYEGLPISILEAMRAGLPVIASHVGGCAELVSDQITGRLARSGDVEHLRECLAGLLADRRLLQAFGQAGRRRFEGEFRVDRMVRQTEAAYAELVPRGFLESGRHTQEPAQRTPVEALR